MNNFHSQFNQETKKEEAAQKATSSWMDNPKLAGMDMSKLAMLNALAEQGSAKKRRRSCCLFSCLPLPQINQKVSVSPRRKWKQSFRY